MVGIKPPLYLRLLEAKRMNDDRWPSPVEINWKYAMVAWEATFPIMKFDDKGNVALLVPRLKCKHPVVQNKDVGREWFAQFIRWLREVGNGFYSRTHCRKSISLLGT